MKGVVRCTQSMTQIENVQITITTPPRHAAVDDADDDANRKKVGVKNENVTLDAWHGKQMDSHICI